jgi:hypothetical protein
LGGGLDLRLGPSGTPRIAKRLEGRCFFLRNESWDIVPRVNHNTKCVPCSFSFVILFQLVSKPVEFNPNDGVPVLVEMRCPSKDFGGETVFLDLVRSALKILVANVLEQPGLLGGFGKDT